MKTTNLINVADIANNETGKTYREENNSLKHYIPIGSLVEIDWDDDSELGAKKHGLRLWVVSHDRDCDGTPLYSLSFDKDWSLNKYGKDFEFFMPLAKDNGYNEESLRVIK